jgi:quinol monooxygenase YgiN
MLGEIQAITGLTRKEDGCEQYVVHTAPDEPGAFAFYERWSSGAHLLAHVSQPFMQTYFAAIAGLAEGDWRPTGCTPSPDPRHTAGPAPRGASRIRHSPSAMARHAGRGMAAVRSTPRATCRQRTV